jgi:superfamily I DNA/RNA helicase
VKPTTEQLDIIKEASKIKNDSVLVIKALAGTAKTTTLKLITDAMPDKYFLYLAFNKAIADEAKSKFGPNVVTRTTHSLAYAYKGSRDIKNSYKAADVAKLLGTNYTDSEEITNLFNEFCNSSHSDLKTYRAEKHIKDKTNELLSLMRKKQIAITHSFYMKEFQLYLEQGGHIKDQFDYVLLDEGQDTNNVTYSIFGLLPGKKIIVGDKHQAIYAFRGAVDALSKSKNCVEKHLSTTFRCSPEIVERVNWILKTYKNEEIEMISGNKSKVKEPETIAKIVRSNASLIEHINDAEEFNLTRQPQAIFECALSLLSWTKGKKDKIPPSYSFLLDFKNRDELNEYVNATNDIELTLNLKCVDKYDSYLYTLYYKAVDMHKKGIKKSLTLTTAHSSKGLEFDSVEISKDFPSPAEMIAELISGGSITSQKQLFTSMKPEVIKVREEMNLYYVAVTRAKYFLEDCTEHNDFYQSGYKLDDIYKIAYAISKRKQKQSTP